MLLHGLTATRRYVVMGSKNLERGGHRVIAYDARGHGRSEPADGVRLRRARRRPAARCSTTAAIERAVLAGASMGAHTLRPLRARAPGARGGARRHHARVRPGHAERGLDRWDALARGLREGGVDGFIEAYGEPRVPEQFRDTVRTVLRQRLSAHEHPEAVADALEQVPRSDAFDVVGRPRARSTSRSRSWRAATRPTPSTRTRSASATPRRSLAPSW